MRGYYTVLFQAWLWGIGWALATVFLILCCVFGWFAPVGIGIIFWAITAVGTANTLLTDTGVSKLQLAREKQDENQDRYSPPYSR